MDIIEIVVIPAGTYVIGDPCYTVEGNDWDHILNVTDFFRDPVGRLADGRLVVGFPTLHGDGTYKGSDGVSYSVDAGLIGAVQVEEGYTTENDSVSVAVFDTDTECYLINRSVIQIGNIIIDTGYEEEWSDDYDED